MSFITDQQTLGDLNILGMYSQHSVYSMFNVMVTSGGKRLLNDLFQNLPDDPEVINQRSDLFRFFQRGKYVFPFDKQKFTTAENYLTQLTYSNPVSALFHICVIQFLRKMWIEEEYGMVEEGLEATVEMLRALRRFVDEMDGYEVVNLFTSQCETVRKMLGRKRLDWVLHPVPGQIPFAELAKRDFQIRYLLKKEMKTILRVIYEMDLYTGVAKVATERNLNYAKTFPKGHNFLSIQALFHPGIKNSVTNDLEFQEGSNLLFLTGANMAGKYTLMKAGCISIYLAHMGFPVPPGKFHLSVKEGIFTSFNVSDNLNLGYNHFYAEAMRVKNIVKDVASGVYLVVLFDELFKGTNVKDAYDATLAITEAFSEKMRITFIISTHIMEVGETLQKKKIDTVPVSANGFKGQYTGLFLPVVRGNFRLSDGYDNYE